MGSNGNGENGEVVKFRPTTLLLDLLERQAISETQLATILSEQNEARESRRLMHKKLDAVTGDMAAVRERSDTTAAKVADLGPKVASHEGLLQNLRGGLIVLGAIGSVVMVAIGFVLKQGWDWIVHHVSLR